MTKKLQITAPETSNKYSLGHRCQIIERDTGEVWFEAHGVTKDQAIERVSVLAHALELAGVEISLWPSYKWPMVMVERFG